MNNSANMPPARPPTQLFDWKATCPEDVARPFPAIIGRGRGEELSPDAIREARRNLRGGRLTGEPATD